MHERKKYPLPTFPMGLSLNDLTDAPRPHCILGCESEFVPGAALKVLQAVRTLAGADGKTAPLLTVVLWVLQDVTWRGAWAENERERREKGEKGKGQSWECH